MKRLIVRAIAMLLLCSGALPADARGFAHHRYLASPRSDERSLVEHRHYRNTEGVIVHSPAHSRGNVAPEGASARCADGSWSFSP